MSYRVQCDWCGEAISTEHDDFAKMPVTIHHPGDGTILGARWAEETRTTRHFCAAAKEDTDRGGRNRMGLVPEAELDSCYDRAIAAIRGTKLGDPGMGMEWRLAPVGLEKPQPMPARQRRRVEEESTHWQWLPREDRDRDVLEAIGEDRLTISEVAAALRAQHAERVVYQGNVRNVVQRLLEAEHLDRVAEEFQGKTRYRYFRKADTSPPPFVAEGDIRGGGN